ncbi:MAG: hypothetical protein NUV74_14980 [Candidatus Brocadiaceae bacterium]|nr:hypothetical protein [Candidatus Brocadiaceae bacterium]
MKRLENVILRGETHKGLLWRLRSQEGGSMSRRIFLAAILGIACAIAPVSAEAQYYGTTNVAKGRPVTALTPSAIGVPQNVTD